MQTKEPEALEKANRLSEEILTYSRNMLFMGLRFMENALSRLVFAPYAGDSIGTDSRYLYYNSDHILRLFRENSPKITRTYLHSVLHCVFRHGYVAQTVDRVLWDTACDIAVEVMLSGLQLTCVDSTIEAQQAQILSVFADKVKPLTAEKLYHFSGKIISRRNSVRHSGKPLHWTTIHHGMPPAQAAIAAAAMTTVMTDSRTTPFRPRMPRNRMHRMTALCLRRKQRRRGKKSPGRCRSILKRSTSSVARRRAT